MMGQEEFDKALKAELLYGEKVKWSAQPVSIWPHFWLALPKILIGLTLLSFVIATLDTTVFGEPHIKINGADVKSRWIISGPTLLFVLFCVRSLAISLSSLLRVSKTVYAITDRRVIITSMLFSRHSISWNIDSIGGIQERGGRNGRGDVLFAIDKSGAKTGSEYVKKVEKIILPFFTIGFRGIENLREVAKILYGVASGDAAAPTKVEAAA